MTTATLTSKGQITIPVGVRKTLKIDTGNRIEFVQIAPDRYELIAVTLDAAELKGTFGQARKRVSIEAMNAVIAKCGGPARWPHRNVGSRRGLYGNLDL